MGIEAERGGLWADAGWRGGWVDARGRGPRGHGRVVQEAARDSATSPSVVNPDPSTIVPWTLVENLPSTSCRVPTRWQ